MPANCTTLKQDGSIITNPASPGRENNVLRSAFGLIWEVYGATLCDSQEIADRVDRQLVQPIDIIDTGRGTLRWNEPTLEGIPPGSLSAMLAKFNPSSMEKKGRLDYERAFANALVIASTILDREIISAEGWSKKEVPIIRQALQEAHGSHIIHLPEAILATSWHDIIIPESNAQYVVYPVQRTWRAQAIPSIIGGKDQRHPFPEEWAGLSGPKLKKISQVESATFADYRRFIVGATSEEGAHLLAVRALEPQVYQDDL